MVRSIGMTVFNFISLFGGLALFLGGTARAAVGSAKSYEMLDMNL